MDEMKNDAATKEQPVSDNTLVPDKDTLLKTSEKLLAAINNFTKQHFNDNLTASQITAVSTSAPVARWVYPF